MASAEFLEEALNTNVDESAVSAIVGSLETQLGGKLSNGGAKPPGPGVQRLQTFPAQGGLTLVHKAEPGKAFPQGAGRVLYPTQGLPRTVALAPFSQAALQVGAQHKPLQAPLLLKPGPTQVGLRPNLLGVPMTSASIPVEIVGKGLSQGAQGGALPTNVQIVNMRPGTPVGGQKSVAAVSPRVVIGSPQVLGGAARPAGTGITLQTLQGFQPGQQGHLLLKTENGQFQLLRVGPPGPGAPAGQAIRLSMPSNPSSPITVLGGAAPQQVSTPQPALVRPAAPTQALQRTPVDNLKEKCRKFLSNLLDLSSKEPKTVERNVRILIQELIDMRVEPEVFCQRLEKLLDASPQPCLIGFLKKTLPILRLSLVNKELVIEGIHPPPLSVVYSNVSTPSSPSIQNVQTTMSPMIVSSASAVHLQGNRIVTQHQSMPAPAVPVTSGKTNTLRNVTKQQSQVSKTFLKVNAGVPSSPSLLGASKQISKEKEKKTTASFSQSAFSDIDKMAADDDINDVAAMGGVNLAEESQKILRSTEMIGTQIRSCKDEYLASMGPLQARLKQIAAKHGLEEPTFDVAALISHALQERLKNLVEKLACIAEHRLDIIKLLPSYEVTQDVKGQLKFLEDLDRVERKRREEYEREILLRAAKSRSKTEDPEQVKLKEKAKEMQRAEMEEMRQREANLTALQAIGPRKKPRLGANHNDSAMSSETSAMDVAMGSKNGAGRSAAPLRARMKRVNYRDLLFLLEQEKDTVRSHLLYKGYLK